MLRLRHELHFREQKSQDILDRPTQMEIAEAWGYRGTEGVLPVEQFMQDEPMHRGAFQLLPVRAVLGGVLLDEFLIEEPEHGHFAGRGVEAEGVAIDSRHRVAMSFEYQFLNYYCFVQSF